MEDDIAIQELTLLENVSIKNIKITEEFIEDLESKYDLYPLYIHIGTYIVYGINKSAKTKRIGKLVISENDKLEIEE